jgi:hypothetical protein
VSDGTGAGLEKSLAELKTLRRGADEIVAPKHTDAGIPVPPARSQVEARGKIVDRDRASVRGNDLKDVLCRRRQGGNPHIKHRVARRRRLLARRADFLKRGVGRLDLAVALRHKTVRGERFSRRVEMSAPRLAAVEGGELAPCEANRPVSDGGR